MDQAIGQCQRHPCSHRWQQMRLAIIERSVRVGVARSRRGERCPHIRNFGEDRSEHRQCLRLSDILGAQTLSGHTLVDPY